MKILGIETSCDETAASVVEVKHTSSFGHSSQEEIIVLSNIVSSQIDIHKKYGGIVPEVAAREHVLNILPVINEALEKANTTHPCLPDRQANPLLRKERENRGVDAIAVTAGPGLITSLQVGVETAKTLAYTWNVPLIAVNHIEGHIYANFIEQQENIKFPAIILTVSGGHTSIILMEGHGKYKTIGETRDDAAGEAFDKAAKLMGLSYPGGPIISEIANKFKLQKNSQLQVTSYKLQEIKLPRPMIQNKNFDFSFSGLKTAIRYALEADINWKNRIPEYCHEFQQAVIDVLIHKTIKAAEKYNVKTIMLAGGVSANTELRKQLEEKIKENDLRFAFHVPRQEFTTDNAVMIAVAGIYKAKRKEFTDWKDLKAECNLKLENI